MIATRFATPFGAFEVLRNGRCVGDTPLHADGCYVARISTMDMRPGDRVVVRYVEESDGMLPDGNRFGGLVPDGGDEDIVNAVVELPLYAVGMGCIGRLSKTAGRCAGDGAMPPWGRSSRRA